METEPPALPTTGRRPRADSSPAGVASRRTVAFGAAWRATADFRFTVVQALRSLEDAVWVEARLQSGFFVRHATAGQGEPRVRSTPEKAVPVDVSRAWYASLQAGAQPGVAPLAAALPAQGCSLWPACSGYTPGWRAAPSPPSRRRQPYPHGRAGLVRQLVVFPWAGAALAEEFVVTNS